MVDSKPMSMNSKVTRLAKHLQLNFKADKTKHTEDKALDSEIDWSASRFIGQLLKSAMLQDILPPQDLHLFHKRYEAEYKLEIDLDRLIEKQWIRFVAGDIQVASGASRLIYDLDHSGANYDFAKAHEKELLFLKALKSQTWSPGLTISFSRKEVTKLLRSYRQIFPNIPSLEALQELQVLGISSTEEILMLNRANKIWQASNELVAAEYWTNLVKDPTFRDDIHRLITWKRFFLGDGYLYSAFQEWLNSENKKRFIAACLKLVLEETDLDWSENEVRKWWWDGHWQHNRNGPEHFPHKFDFNCRSVFELFFEVKNFTDHFYWTTTQASRSPIFFFVRQILYAESQFLSDSRHSFSKTRVLFKASSHKPYLLWVLSNILQYDHPEAIPYLLTETQTAPWGMWLLEKIKPTNSFYGGLDQVERNLTLRKQISQIWLEGFEVILESLSQKVLSEPIKTDALFNTLYFVAYNSSENVSHSNFVLADEYRSRYQKAISLLESHRINEQINSIRWLKPYLFPHLMGLFVEKVKSGRMNVPSNEVKSIDIGRWEMYFLILRLINTPLTTHEIHPTQRAMLLELSKKAVDYFLDYYTHEFNQDEIKVQTYFDASLQTKKVKWQSEPFALSQLDWSMFVEQLVEHGTMKRFFNAYQFDLPDKKKQSLHSVANQSQVKKGRIYLRILLLMHHAIAAKKHQFFIKHASPDTILSQLEEEIIDVGKNNVDDPQNGIIDFFDTFYEGDTVHYYGEGLLPHLFRVADAFQGNNKEKLLSIFLQSDLDRLLLIYNFLKGASEKGIIKAAIDQIDLDTFIKKIRWRKVLENAVIQAINSADHLPLAEKLLSYLEDDLNYFKGPQQQEMLVYLQSKAVQAWRRNDLTALKAISLPEKIHFSEEIKNGFLKYKNLLLGAYYHKHDRFDEAIELLEQLSKVDKYDVEITARLYCARTDKFMSSENINFRALERAYSEWEDFEKRLKVEKNSKSIHSFIDSINVCKLVRSHYHEWDREFDYHLEKINQVYLYQRGVLEVITKNFQRRNKTIEAEQYLLEAKQYHRAFSENTPDWIDPLRADLNRIDITKVLSSNFNLMLAQTPLDLIKIIPPNLSGNAQNVADFLLYHAVESAALLLEKITAINKAEDRYNDVFVLILKSRLLTWDWQVDTQPPGGRSGNLNRSDTSGERDWVITAQGSNIAIFEALIWSPNTRKKYLTDHLTKLLIRYSPTLRIGFLVIYYTRRDSQFEKEWKKYKETIDSFNFSERFEKKEDMLEIEHSCGTQNMKVGKTIYGSNTNTIEIYHLYLNLNFGT